MSDNIQIGSWGELLKYSAIPLFADFSVLRVADDNTPSGALLIALIIVALAVNVAAGSLYYRILRKHNPTLDNELRNATKNFIPRHRWPPSAFMPYFMICANAAIAALVYGMTRSLW